MLTDEEIRATFRAWAEPALEGAQADHPALIDTHRRLRVRRHRRIATLASVSVLAVAAATTVTVLELRKQIQSGTEPSVSLTATPTPSFTAGGPTVRVLGHQLAFPAGWSVPPPTPVVESPPMPTPLIEDISPSAPSSAIRVDIRVFASHLAHTRTAQVHSAYPTRTATIAGHRVVIARPVTFPSSWACTTPEELVDCQEHSSSAAAVPWVVDTHLTIGVNLGHDYARINSTGLTANQAVALLKIMLRNDPLTTS